MKKMIGGIILAMVFAFLVGLACVAYGWKVGLAIWTAGIACTILIVYAIYLITEGK